MAHFNCQMISYSLRRTVDLTVIVPSVTFPEMLGDKPPRHHQPHRYPVLYLLHGFGNNHTCWTSYTNVEMYAEERNIAVVMLSGENRHYVNWPDGNRYFDFIQKELPDFVQWMFPVSARPEDTYIAGLSMGGYGALLHGLNAPENYGAIGSFSGAVMPGKDRVPDSLLSWNPQLIPITAAKEAVRQGKKLPKVYLACGGKDGFLQKNLEFKAEMEEIGADVTWSEMEEYGHEWRFWEIQIERFLDWLPRTDGFALDGNCRRKI